VVVSMIVENQFVAGDQVATTFLMNEDGAYDHSIPFGVFQE